MKNAFNSLLDHPEFREGQLWDRKRFPAGETLFEQGDEGQEIYIVLSGTVRVVGDVVLDEGQRIHPGVCDLEEGAIFGEMPLFDQQPRSASVVAITDCELAVIDNQALLDFFELHPAAGYTAMCELWSIQVGRLRRTNKKLFSLFAWGLKIHQISPHL